MRCWLRGMRLRWATEHDIEASLKADERRKKLKTDIYGPGEPFEFVGFEFDGPRVYIRQETLAKAKSRLEQYTQRSVRIIESAAARGNTSMGKVLRDADSETGDIAVVSVVYVRNAIRRINLFLGFKTCMDQDGSQRKRVTYCPGYGFPWSILKCVDYADVREQFAILDGCVFNRLKRLQCSLLGPRSAELGHLYDFSKFDFRAEGLKTFKDVANRFPESSGNSKGSGRGG
jgi:hypothetical protein